MARRNQKPGFAVIGLGRFGTSLALGLVERGHNVLGIDRDREHIQRLADESTQVVALDATDEDSLQAVDITSFDTVVVAIGTNFEANLMTTLALKSLGVRHIVCKALTPRQQTALLAVGAGHVVLPEHESARRLASETVRRASVVLTVSVVTVGVTTWLLIMNHTVSIDDALFTIVSAFATTGLSLPFTAELNAFGRIVVMLMMFWGRLGALTIVVALARPRPPQPVTYPEEQLLIG